MMGETEECGNKDMISARAWDSGTTGECEVTQGCFVFDLFHMENLFIYVAVQAGAFWASEDLTSRILV